MRNQAETYKFTAPDGNEAIVVENTPTNVTFYVAEGEHQGYYHYDKQTNKYSIASG
jgi:peptide methionine sulfoxide reductase MsrA